MTRKRRTRDTLPTPERLEWEFDELASLLANRAEIVQGYKMARDLGLDPRSGTLGASVSAGLSDYVPDAAWPYRDEDGKLSLPAVYRSIAQGIYGKIVAARQNLGNALEDCHGGRMGSGVKQVRPKDRGVPNPELLRASLEARCRREGHQWQGGECRLCGMPVSASGGTS